MMQESVSDLIDKCYDKKNINHCLCIYQVEVLTVEVLTEVLDKGGAFYGTVQTD